MPMSTTSTKPDLIQHLTELLNEEKWTRAAINNYTVGNFQELDAIVHRVSEEDLETEVRELCEEHLQHTKNSIIALYISGVLDLGRQSMDDANLILLTKIFTDNHKWNIVEYLANRILEFGENRFALRILADVYNNENETEKLHDVWERLIRVDYEEADIVRHLAEIREENGETDLAVEYYKKALHRYITKKSFANVKEVWHKLVQLAPNEGEFFYHAESKIARTISTERAVQLLEDLYPHYKKDQDWDRAIELLKRVLSYDSKSPWARKEIVECFQEKFADHSNLEEYIRVSNITQSWRPIHEAIADFEKHISFDTGNFVFHRSWGIGRIRAIDGDDITIDFANKDKRGHKMSLKMAINSLDVLPKDHIWVLRAVWKKQKLHDLVKKNPIWALKTVIRSLGNSADMKKIKAELVPSILSPGEWSSWSTKARQILKTNPDFGTLTDKVDHFVVRDQPITFEEKTFNKFKAEKTFFDRAKTFEEFISYVAKEGDGVDSEFFREMFEYFASFVRNPAQVNEYVIASLIVLRDVVSRFPFLRNDLELDFDTVYQQIDDLEGVFSRIDSTDLKKRFLTLVRKHDKNWGPVFARLLPYHLSRDVLVDLEKAGQRDLILAFIGRVYENYRDMREPFVWLVRNCQDDPWFEELGITLEKRLIAMIHVFDLTFRDIDNRKDVSYNRKLNKQVHTYLIKEGNLPRFIEEADEESVSRIFTLISDVKEMDPKELLDLKQAVLNRFPDFRFYGEDTVEASTKKLLYCTAAMYDAKQAEYKYLQEVEVPQNSKEIEQAREYGDLKENAEYKAAKERQDSLNNRAARLKTELEQARIVKPGDVDPTRVAFGTRVTFADIEAGRETTYTILGPWESNPDEGVINYQSPLGNRLLGSAPGDELDFEINEKRYHLRVSDVSVAEFS